jgi:hypothetical protein
MGVPAKYVDELNSCKFLFLRGITELGGNSLRLIVEEGLPESEEVSRQVVDVQITGGHLVRSTESSRRFEIIWDSYIAYSLTNEIYATAEKYEKAESGRRCQVFSDSHFLDYISRTSCANSEYPGPFDHVCVNCEDQIVNIVSKETAQVRLLPPSASEALEISDE